MFTYKKAPYKIFTLGPKFCWAGPANKTRKKNTSAKTRRTTFTPSQPFGKL